MPIKGTYLITTRFQGITKMLGISVLWDISYATTLHYPEYGNSKISRNVGIHIPVCMAPNLRALVLLCRDDVAGFSKLRTAPQAV